MRCFLTITVALCLTHQATHAADISVVAEATSDHPALILIKGKIENEKREVRALEVRQFEALAGFQEKPAIVLLDSPGGAVMNAIQIGLLIQKHGFSTAVADYAQCSSACALIWIAGKERFISTKLARVGFHAARMNEITSDAASGANAVVGAYLYQIGITDFQIIMQLTSAPPQIMRWLSFYGDPLTQKLGAKEFSLSEPRWTWARAALDGKSREPTAVTVAASPKVSAPVQPKRASQTAIVIPPPSPSRCEGTEAHIDNEIRCLKPKNIFKDCPDCPEMVVLPAGEFPMGSEQSKDEEPVHKVTIPKPFAASKYAVTFDNWDACVIAGGCKLLPDDRNWGRGNRPVMNVSWEDVTKQYLPWLSRVTHKTYRLLTEAEWEYAARAGGPGKYPWGEEIRSNRGNCDGCGSQWDKKQTAPVGSFEPNAFGLYDMHGNVWQWVGDCYHDNYDAAPADGSAWTEDCKEDLRVLRGGSFMDVPTLIRSASRVRHNSGVQSGEIGFRVARTLAP